MVKAPVNRLKSRLSAGISAADYDPEQLAEGQRVEMEHTDDPAEAERIAMDHLVEDPCYYSKLRLIHKQEEGTRVGGSFPVAAGLAVVADDTGRVLMLQRQLDPDDPNSGKWEFPGGKLEDGETPIDAAYREWAEETGLKRPGCPRSGNLLKWESTDGKYVGFVVRVPSELLFDFSKRDLFSDPDSEVGGVVAWVDPKDLPQHNLRPALLQDIDEVTRRIMKWLVRERSVRKGIHDLPPVPFAVGDRVSTEVGDGTVVRIGGGGKTDHFGISAPKAIYVKLDPGAKYGFGGQVTDFDPSDIQRKGKKPKKPEEPGWKRRARIDEWKKEQYGWVIYTNGPVEPIGYIKQINEVFYIISETTGNPGDARKFTFDHAHEVLQRLQSKHRREGHIEYAGPLHPDEKSLRKSTLRWKGYPIVPTNRLVKGGCKPGETAAQTGCTPAEGGGSSTGSSTEEEEQAPSTTRSKPSTADTVKQVYQAAFEGVKAGKEHVQAVANRLGNAVWSKLPPKSQQALAKTYAYAKHVEHKLMTGFRKSREMAEQLGAEWNLKPESVVRLGRILGTVDMAAAWTVSMPAAYAATGSTTVAKVASWVPVASLAFIAGSTVVNPYKTLRAAKELLKRGKAKFLGGGTVTKGREEVDPATLAERLAEIPAEQQEWYEALVVAALEETDYDLGKALELADRMFDRRSDETFAKQPTNTQEKGETVMDVAPERTLRFPVNRLKVTVTPEDQTLK